MVSKILFKDGSLK